MRTSPLIFRQRGFPSGLPISGAWCSLSAEQWAKSVFPSMLTSSTTLKASSGIFFAYSTCLVCKMPQKSGIWLSRVKCSVNRSIILRELTCWSIYLLVCCDENDQCKHHRCGLRTEVKMDWKNEKEVAFLLALAMDAKSGLHDLQFKHLSPEELKVKALKAMDQRFGEEKDCRPRLKTLFGNTNII